jgi:ADP-heptose:LPS heptosyltransferase
MEGMTTLLWLSPREAGMSECRCVDAGWCARHKMHKTEHLHNLCQNSESHRSMWDKAAASSRTCVHIGDPTGQSLECKPCRGGVSAQIRRCALHGFCVEGAVPSFTYQLERMGIPRPKSCLACDDWDSGKSVVLLRHNLSMGDVVCMSAAVMELVRQYGDRYQVVVSTTCHEVWEGNKFVRRYDPSQHDPEMEFVVEYAAGQIPGVSAGIDHCNSRPHHMVEAFCENIGAQIGITLRPKNWNDPSIFLSDEEKSWIPQVREDVPDSGRPVWLLNAGTKHDYTAKEWWGYQRVVDETKHLIEWVQVGQEHHRHGPIHGAMNLLGKTDLRQLIRAVYHCDGVLTGVSGLMHLAHWVEKKSGKTRSAVVVGGGREPHWWYSYPRQQVVHTVGMMPCCHSGGCWRSRTVPLGDGSEQDSSLCEFPTQVDAAGVFPGCMAQISHSSVVDAVLLACNAEKKFWSQGR